MFSSYLCLLLIFVLTTWFSRSLHSFQPGDAEIFVELFSTTSLVD